MALTIRKGLRVEEVEGEAIVLDRSGEAVHRVTGEAVEALRLLEEGVDPDQVPARLAPAMDSLSKSGIVANPTLWSRRRALQVGGAAFTAAAVTTFALVEPAAAATMCGPGITPSGPTKFDMSGTFTTGPGITSVLVRAWGGGGGGGGSTTAFPARSGSGAGGGEYTYNASLNVVGCTMYTVTVGGGGAGGGNGSNGANGGVSSFATLHTAAGGGMGNYGGPDGTGGMGGMTTGGMLVAFAGGGGGTDANLTGGGGGGAGGSTGPGGDGGNGMVGMGGGGGAGGTGTPPGGMGGAGATNGSSPGGGAGGGATTNNPGNGAPGAVWVNF